MKTIRKATNIVINGDFDNHELKPWSKSSKGITDILNEMGTNGSKCILLRNAGTRQRIRGNFRPSIVILRGKVFTSGNATAFVSITALDGRSRYDYCYGLRGTVQEDNIISHNKWSDIELRFPFDAVRYADQLSVFLLGKNAKGDEDYVLFDDIVVELK